MLRRAHTRARWWPAFVAAAFLLLTALRTARAGDRSPPGAGPGGRGGTSPAGAATVVRVVDGDTVILRLGGADQRVRLIGIDTPETVKPGTPVQCWGPEASAHTKHL